MDKYAQTIPHQIRNAIIKTVTNTYFDAGKYAMYTHETLNMYQENTRPNSCILFSTRFKQEQSDMQYIKPTMQGSYSTSTDPGIKQLTIFQFLQHLHWEMNTDIQHYILLAFCEKMHNPHGTKVPRIQSQLETL